MPPGAAGKGVNPGPGGPYSEVRSWPRVGSQAPYPGGIWMPLHPSKSLYFDSWEKLLQWLPEANETQLMVVFVWSGDLKAPPGNAARLAQVRKEAFEHLVGRTCERLKRFLTQRCQCRDLDLADDVVQQVLIKLYLRA